MRANDRPLTAGTFVGNPTAQTRRAVHPLSHKPGASTGRAASASTGRRPVMNEDKARAAGRAGHGKGSSGERPALTPGTRWRQVFPGEERQIGLMRRWLASLLPDCPARDDVTVVASELTSNAVLHTASGQGGWFAVEIIWYPLVVRVTVEDGGAPAGPRLIDDPER